MGRYVKQYVPSSGGTVYSGTLQGDASGTYSTPGTWEPINVCCNWITPINNNTIQYNYNFSQWEMIKFVMHGAFGAASSVTSVLVAVGNNSCPCNTTTCYVMQYGVPAPSSCQYVCCHSYICMPCICNSSNGASFEVCFWPGRTGCGSAYASGLFAKYQIIGTNACYQFYPSIGYYNTGAAVYYGKCVDSTTACNAFTYLNITSGGLTPASSTYGITDAYFGIYGMRRAIGPTSNITCG